MNQSQNTEERKKVGVLLWSDFSLPNTFSSLVRLGVVYPKKIVKIRNIFVYFNHFWSLCDGQHCSIGLLWGIWIEPRIPNIPMLLVWPEHHFGVVYPEKLMKIWTISVSFLKSMQRATLLSWFCGRYELSRVPPTPLCYRFYLGTTLKWYTLRWW